MPIAARLRRFVDRSIQPFEQQAGAHGIGFVPVAKRGGLQQIGHRRSVRAFACACNGVYGTRGACNAYGTYGALLGSPGTRSRSACRHRRLRRRGKLLDVRLLGGVFRRRRFVGRDVGHHFVDGQPMHELVGQRWPRGRRRCRFRRGGVGQRRQERGPVDQSEHNDGATANAATERRPRKTWRVGLLTCAARLALHRLPWRPARVILRHGQSLSVERTPSYAVPIRRQTPASPCRQVPVFAWTPPALPCAEP